MFAPTTRFPEHVSPSPHRTATHPATCLLICSMMERPSSQPCMKCVQMCASLHECVCPSNLFFSGKQAPSVVAVILYIWSRAKIKAFICPPSFTWCLNWNPHEILRKDENGGISLPPILMLQWPWLLCVTNQSSQRIFCVVTLANWNSRKCLCL